MKILLPFLILTVLLSSCLSDIRPKDYRSDSLISEESRSKGIALIEKYSMFSGAEQWANVRSYEVDFADDFLGFKGRFAHPYSQKSNRFRLRYNPSKMAGTLEFRNGEDIGQIWGYDEGRTYTKTNSTASKIAKKDKSISFWIPTYQYFIEFPFRIKSAEIIHHIGEKKYGLEIYDLVFVTWKSAKPQRKYDQYLLWISQSTGLIDKLQYTIRDQNGILKGTTIISDYQNYNGIRIPAMYKVYLREQSTKPLHIMRVVNFRANNFDPSTLDL